MAHGGFGLIASGLLKERRQRVDLRLESDSVSAELLDNEQWGHGLLKGREGLFNPNAVALDVALQLRREYGFMTVDMSLELLDLKVLIGEVLGLGALGALH